MNGVLVLCNKNGGELRVEKKTPLKNSPCRKLCVGGFLEGGWDRNWGRRGEVAKGWRGTLFFINPLFSMKGFRSFFLKRGPY